MKVMYDTSGEFDFKTAWNKLFPPENPDPVTGVIDANKCREWIYEEINNGTDLGLIEHLRECEDHKSGRGCECEIDDWGQVLIGDWKKSWEWRMPGGRAVKARTPGSKRHQVWVEVKDGKEGYSAIYNKGSYTIQVAWSKWVFQDARWCSPCYPGQADLNSQDGGVVAYQLPPELSRCIECHDYEREVVYATDAEGRMLCDVCCEKFGIDFKTGLKKAPKFYFHVDTQYEYHEGQELYHVFETNRTNEFGEPYCVAPFLAYEVALQMTVKLNKGEG